MATEEMAEELPVDPLELAEVEDTPDGGAVLTIDVEEGRETAHFDNIVDDIDTWVLDETVTWLVDVIKQDKEDREERDKIYEEGIRRTGLGNDAPGGATFQGASKTVHPLLSEACVDFAARAMKELFPPNGPVRAKVMGVKDRDKLDKAQRKTEFMNWQSTEQIREFRSDLEKLLTQVPLGGGQYLKWRFDHKLKRITTEFVPIDDILLPFNASNFYAAQRRTHVQRITELDLQQRIKSGMYIDLQLPAAPAPEQTESAQANDKIEGKQQGSVNEDGVRTLYEVEALLDIERGEGDDEEREFKPYIITIDHSTSECLAIYRNWAPDDETFTALDWTVEFPMIPWRGAYPIGMTHMIGGLTGAATGALRALLDSAHINNIPALLKLKSATKGENVMIGTTQVTELDGGMADDIRKLVMPIPFNGPSAVLFQLLGFLVDAGKGVVRTSFEDLPEINANSPVGTTLALIEQGLVVFSSIHARLHASMDRCLRILHRLNATYLPDQQLAAYGGTAVQESDFTGPMDVIPVSDPNIFSDTQRFAQVQAIMQRADAKPQLYDARLVEEMFLRQLKIPADEVLTKKEEPENLDPASENVAMTMGGNAFVLPRQDHIGHLRVLIDFARSPVFGTNPVMAQTFLVKAVTHARDHMLQYYLKECHEAVRLAIEREIIAQDDGSGQAMVIAKVTEVVQEQLKDIIPIVDAMAKQVQAMMPQPPQDPTLAVASLNAQVQQGNQQIAREGQQLNSAIQGKKLELEGQKVALKAQEQQLDMAAAARDAQADERDTQLMAELEDRKLQLKADEQELDRQIALLKEQGEDRRRASTDALRYQMNTDDNKTALTIAAAEIASSEKVDVSTGTGLNPSP